MGCHLYAAVYDCGAGAGSLMLNARDPVGSTGSQQLFRVAFPRLVQKGGGNVSKGGIGDGVQWWG